MMQCNCYIKCIPFYSKIFSFQIIKSRKPNRRQEILDTVFLVRCTFLLLFILFSSVLVSLPFWESAQQLPSSQQANWHVKIAAVKVITNSAADTASNITVNILRVSSEEPNLQW